ncbi:MAG: DNA-binding transcriptional ArsR family regulator/precorrin-6B methylase 2 [Myxococcota bacterium]|jgi:DNA-binding transcriptional ArsR family regulator/precorrin-6B methylase 2
MSIQPAELATVFRVLGDPSRLRALLLLRREELTVGELKQVLGVAQSTVSTLLRNLMDAGLVEARREGRHAFYRALTGIPIVDQALEDASPAAVDVEALAGIRAARLGGADATLGNFDRCQAPGRSWRTLSRSLLQRAEFGVVADLGVGSGELTLLLAQASEHLYAVDAEPATLSHLEREASQAGIGNITAVAGDFEALSLPQPVDLVCVSLSLAAAEHPSRVLAGAFAALRPGGRIWVTELAAHDQTWTRERFGHRWLGFEPDHVTALMTTAGFRNISLTRGSRERKAPHFQTLVVVGHKPAANRLALLHQTETESS